MIKIVVFEDNLDFIEGLHDVIGETDDMTITGVYNNSKDASRRVAQTEPDIILMDIDMPQENGLHGLRDIRRVNEEVPIIMLTVFDDNENIFEAICNGATGYLLKKTHPDELIRYIREAKNGGAPMTPSIGRKVLQLFSQPFRNKKNFEQLTTREHEVLSLLVRGFSYKMIGGELDISNDTVSTHIKRIYVKLQVNSKSEAVAKALHNKIT